MKFRMLKGKKICAITLAAVCMLAGMKVYLANAATAITQETTKLTIAIPSEVREDYKGNLDLVLYKVADMTESGTLANEIKEGLLSDYSSYAGENSAELSAKLCQEAKAYIEGLSDEERAKLNPVETSISADKSSVSLDVKNGLYLIVANEGYVEGSVNGYTFNDVLVTAPMNYYVDGAQASLDTWNFDVSVELKYSYEPIYGNLLIDKTLTTFNMSLSNACFVYSVEAYRGDELVYSNAVSMDFKKSGKSQVEVTHIPANTRVVVTEVYTGATYKNVDEAVKVIDSLPSEYAVEQGEKEAEVAYTNDYNDDLMTGSLATVNTVTYENDSFGLSVIGDSSKNYDMN